MTSLDGKLAAAVRHADRYRNLNGRAGARWQVADHQRAISQLLGAAGHYRAAALDAARSGDPRAGEIERRAIRAEQLADDHGLWVELGIASAAAGGREAA